MNPFADHHTHTPGVRARQAAAGANPAVQDHPRSSGHQDGPGGLRRAQVRQQHAFPGHSPGRAIQLEDGQVLRSADARESRPGPDRLPGAQCGHGSQGRRQARPSRLAVERLVRRQSPVYVLSQTRSSAAMLMPCLAQHYLTHLLRQKLEASRSRVVVVSSGAIRGVVDTCKHPSSHSSGRYQGL